MTRFYILTGNGYVERKGYKVTIPGYEHLLLFAHKERKKYWTLTEGWGGFAMLFQTAAPVTTKQALIERAIEDFKRYENRGRTIDDGIRQGLESGYMAPMPI